MGKGLLSANADSTAKTLRQQQQVIQANYASTAAGADTGLLSSAAGQQVAQAQPRGLLPKARFDQVIYSQTVYDPATGRFVAVPMAQA